jgi:MFS family permease
LVTWRAGYARARILEEGFGAGHTTIALVAIIYNIGAILGGAYFGALSQHFGRRRTIMLCGALALPIAPLFSSAPTLATVAPGGVHLGSLHARARAGRTAIADLDG